MLVGRERTKSVEIRESAGPARRDAALRVPAFPAENGFRGSWRWRRQPPTTRRHDHAHIGPATSSGYRATGAGRPAGRLQQLCLLSRVARYARASRENSMTPMHRRPDATAAATLRFRKRVEAISGSDTTLKRANKDRSSLSLLYTLLSLFCSHTLSLSLSLSFLLSISICLAPSVLRARTMYITAPCQTRHRICMYIYARMHTSTHGDIRSLLPSPLLLPRVPSFSFSLY